MVSQHSPHHQLCSSNAHLSGWMVGCRDWHAVSGNSTKIPPEGAQIWDKDCNRWHEDFKLTWNSTSRWASLLNDFQSTPTQCRAGAIHCPFSANPKYDFVHCDTWFCLLSLWKKSDEFYRSRPNGESYTFDIINFSGFLVNGRKMSLQVASKFRFVEFFSINNS